MGKIGWGEFLVILIIALVVVGPDKLPKLGQSLGKAVASVKKYVNETSKEIEGLDELKNVKNDIESIQKDVKNIGKNLEKQITEMPSEEKKTKEDTAEDITENTAGTDSSSTEMPVAPDESAKSENTAMGTAENDVTSVVANSPEYEQTNPPAEVAGNSENAAVEV